MAFTYSLDDFAVMLLCNQEMALQPLSVESTHVRVFPRVNALSALVFLLVCSWVSIYYFITREKEEAAWKTLFIP